MSISCRPQTCKTNQFYLRPRVRVSSDVWYMDAPVGVHTLQETVKKMRKEGGFVGNFTNHSLRATAATRLYADGVDEQLIAEKTGHRSNAIRAYKRACDEQQMKLREILECGNDDVKSDDDVGAKSRRTKADIKGESKSGVEVKVNSGDVSICVRKF